jgi:ADP-ribosylglycohydrolase
MIGAIAGDIIGSIYERRGIKNKDFPLFSQGCRFTDDSVLSIALAEAIITGASYEQLLREYYHRYPHVGYGGMFLRWTQDPNSKPYNSFGNGSAMRISAVGFAFETMEAVLNKARLYTEITHNHPEGIKGAQAVAAAIFMGRTGGSKDDIRHFIENTCRYDLSRTLDEIRPGYGFDVTCQGSVPEAIIAFLESTSYEDAIRNAISLGGDSDTQACITGGIAQAFYGSVPEHIVDEAFAILDDHLRSVTIEFMQLYCGKVNFFKGIKKYQ